MHFSALFATLLAAGIALAMPADPLGVADENTAVIRSEADAAMVDSTRGCGLIFYTNGKVQTQHGTNTCVTGMDNIKSYKIDGDCVCAYFNAPGCSWKRPDLVRWAPGPSTNALPRGVRYFKCWTKNGA